MKQLKFQFCFIVLFLLSGSICAQDLSFNVDVTSPKSNEPFVMKVLVSGTKVVMHPPGNPAEGKMSFMMDNATGKQYMMMDANGQKMAMPVDMSKIEEKTEAVKQPKITQTKETKVIDGYKCTKVISETDETKTDIWITQDINYGYAEFFKMMNSSKGPKGPVSKIPALENIKGFPIEVSSTDKAKSETTTLKFKNISKAKIDPKEFSLEGYQMMDPKMMGR